MDGSRVGTLTVRYVAGLLVIALLLLAGQAVVQQALNRQASDARVVNLAGRQRMLSQRLCVELLALEQGREDEATARLAQLVVVTDEWSRDERALQEGSPELGLPGDNGAHVRELFALITPHHEAMLQDARDALARRVRPEGQLSPARDALSHESAFLEGMDRIVAQYEVDARARVLRLRRIELALLGLALFVLLLEATLVFRPAVDTLRSYVRTIESSEDQKRTVLKALPDRLLLLARDGSCAEVSTDRRTSRPQPKPRRPLPEVLPADVAAQCIARASAALESKTVQMFEYAARAQGSARRYELRMVAYSDDEVLLVIRDITETARLQRELLLVSDREQQRIGQDLHDGLGQQLVGISILVKSMRQKLADGPLAEDMNQIGKLLAEAVDQTRSLARGLHSLTLEHEGLAAALREIAVNTERIFGVTTTVHYAAKGVQLPSDVCVHLHRIAREAVANAAKHASAKNIEIRVEIDKGMLTLAVTDDGVGIAAANGGGMGLHLMDYRARMLGAWLDVERIPAGGTGVGGTRVACTVPLADLTPVGAQA